MDLGSLRQLMPPCIPIKMLPMSPMVASRMAMGWVQSASERRVMASNRGTSACRL